MTLHRFIPYALPALLCPAVVSCALAQPQQYEPGFINAELQPWSQLGGNATHNTLPRTQGFILDDLSPSGWNTTGDGDLELSFTPQAGVVADELNVYAVGLDQQFKHHLAAFDQQTGSLAWATDISFPLLDSWSTPAIDLNNDTIVVASGFTIAGLDRFTGDELWTTPLSTPIVNASPCLTQDLDGSNRLFITDYSFGSGALGSLICINIDPESSTNPYQPGEIIWTAPLPGECSGNTPAYEDGVVYVSTADNGFGGPGHVLAFDATSNSTPTPLWDTPNPQPVGFFSAVTVADGFVYASSYNFNGLQRSANTIKLEANTGTLQWSAPTVRTDAAPLILPNDRIIVSGGVPTSPTAFFTGSLPAIELIHDLGTSAVVAWDSFEATHDDINDSGTWDPGEPFLSIGGWGHQPIAFIASRRTMLLVGTMSPPTGFNPFSHGSDLHTIDLSKHPSDPDFVRSTITNAGTSPAIIHNSVFSTSNSGLTRVELSTDSQSPATQAQHIRAILDGQRPVGSYSKSP